MDTVSWTSVSEQRLRPCLTIEVFLLPYFPQAMPNGTKSTCVEGAIARICVDSTIPTLDSKGSISPVSPALVLRYLVMLAPYSTWNRTRTTFLLHSARLNECQEREHRILKGKRY